MEYTDSIKNETPVDIQKISFFEYLFVLMLILYAGRSNTFFESGSFTQNTVGVLLPVVLSVILAFKWNVVFNKQFYTLIFFFAIYFLAVSIKYKVIQPTFFLTYLFLIFISYSAVKALKFNLYIIYEYLLYYLAIIGLFMWGVQIILGGDTLFYYFDKIPLLQQISFVSGEGLNAILYSVQPSFTSLLYNFTIPRNCGYAWEPGSFAVYLCLAIFVNLFIQSSDKTSKKRFWILAMALLSTQSTTGYIIFMIIIVFYIINKNLQRALLLFPIVFVLLIALSSLPFMKNKIFELINETSVVDQLVIDAYGRESPATPQRFTSLKITMVDFRNNPILGLAAHYEDTWTYKLGSSISTISGIGNLLAQFGLVGFLFFIILSVRSSFTFAKYFNYKGKFLLFIIIISISISYTIIFIPLIMSFWMFSLFDPQVVDLKEENDRVLN